MASPDEERTGWPDLSDWNSLEDAVYDEPVFVGPERVDERLKELLRADAVIGIDDDLDDEPGAPDDKSRD